MKNLNYSLTTLRGVVFFCIFCCIFSCINDIDTESEENEKDIPVVLNTRIQQDGTTGDMGDFEENAEIGIYIVSVNSSLAEQRHISNMRFLYSETSGFQPEEEVYFPEDNGKCNFFAYYPYRTDGIEEGESVMEVKVNVDQTDKDGFSQSDFLIATSNNISPATDPVNLTFKHKFNRINIQIKPEEGYTAEEILATNPEVIIKGVFTQTFYNFDEDCFINPNTPGDLLANGEWKIVGGVLKGKSVIVVPQEISTQHSLFEVRTDTGDYLYNTPANYEFTQSGVSNLIITLSPNSETVKCTIDASIEGWGEPEDKEITAGEIKAYIKTDDLKFNDSNIYEVFHRDNKVAEICLEYLLNDNINAQAVVIYPVKDGQTDLQSGRVVKVLGETANKNGGWVSWDISNNSLSYTEGDLPVINYIYISSDGVIRTTRPENALQLQLKPMICTDIRGTESIKYPLVKIGTQYWMRNNLKATKYTDGTDIYKSDDFTDPSAKFFVNVNYYFYNFETIKTGLLIPEGWRVANSSDWERLDTYIDGNASILKKGDSWKLSSFDATNLSGFNAVATGYYNKAEQINIGRYAFYWSTFSNNPTEVEKVLSLEIENNSLTKRTIYDTYGLSVRCLKND